MLALGLPRSLFPLLLVAGLLVPGWLLARALRTPAGAIGAFLGSAALLLNLLLALDALQIRLQAAQVAAALAVVSLVLVGIARRRSGERLPHRTAHTEKWRWQRHHCLLIPAAIGFGAIVLKALLDPLAGFDTVFRWEFLARQMLHAETLRFYPPVTSSDFQFYGWCDGIAPLISSLYFWSYLCAGGPFDWATTPIVIGQAALLFRTVHQLAKLRGSPPAAPLALSILATSPVLLWGVSLGQETALTALSLVATFLFLEKAAAEPEAQWLVWAGIATGIGALAREYGLAFILLGAVMLAWRRASFRSWIKFGTAAAAVAGPWYLRNWIKTGNPLYAHGLGDLFPTNPLYSDYNRIVGELRGVTSSSDTAGMVALLFVSLAGFPIVLGLSSGIRRWREFGGWTLAILAVVALWLWSVGLTSGGPTYSLRVLTPAIALGTVLGAVGMQKLATSRYVPWVAAGIAIWAFDAGARALRLPTETEIAWWRGGAHGWRAFNDSVRFWRASPDWAVYVDAADGRQIVTSDPVCHAVLVKNGAQAVTLFSPALQHLFGPLADFPSRVARLREDGVRFLLLTRNNDINDRLLRDHGFFRALSATRPVVSTPLYFIYDLYSPELRSPPDTPTPRAPQ